MRGGSTLALVGLLSAASPGVAVADEINDLGRKIFEAETQVRELDQAIRPPAKAGPELADRRLVDAQLMYALKNYEEAAILLMDVVERFPNTAAYPEALFLLADALYQKRDYRSARRYYEQV